LREGGSSNLSSVGRITLRKVEWGVVSEGGGFKKKPKDNKKDCCEWIVRCLKWVNKDYVGERKFVAEKIQGKRGGEGQKGLGQTPKVHFWARPQELPSASPLRSQKGELAMTKEMDRSAGWGGLSEQRRCGGRSRWVLRGGKKAFAAKTFPKK